MKRIALTAALAGLLLFSSTALADEQKQNDGQSGGYVTTLVQPATKKVDSKVDAQSQDTPTEEHENMKADNNQDMDMDMDMSSDEHQNMDMGTGGSSSHGGHENVVETPPNVPVLSTFAAINAAFLLIGIWNKWIRKKGGVTA